jgi:hypothetical protein
MILLSTQAIEMQFTSEICKHIAYQIANEKIRLQQMLSTVIQKVLAPSLKSLNPCAELLLHK